MSSNPAERASFLDSLLLWRLFFISRRFSNQGSFWLISSFLSLTRCGHSFCNICFAACPGSQINNRRLSAKRTILMVLFLLQPAERASFFLDSLLLWKLFLFLGGFRTKVPSGCAITHKKTPHCGVFFFSFLA